MASRTTFGKAGLQRFQEIYAEAEDRESELTDWERKFLDDLNKNTMEYAERTYVSDAQCEALRKIARKLNV